MSHFFAIHPDNPQARLLRKAVLIIRDGGVVIYPTDSGYAIGCSLGNKAALERIRRLRQLDKSHNMTLIARDLMQVGTYAKISTVSYRLLKAFTPGAYTFILNATNAVPKLMLYPKRRTLGLRIPNNIIALSLVECLETPLMSTTLILPQATVSMSEPDAIHELLGNQIDLIIDGGNCGYDPTTIVDLTGDYPVILRVGKGSIEPFKAL